MVPGRTLFILVSLFFLIFVYCTSHTFGETHDGGSSSDLIVRRLAPGEELTDRKVEVLAKEFHLPASYVKGRYSDRFNKAAASASKGDFRPMAGIFAELFGTINGKQLAGLLKDAKAEKEAENAKTPPDARFVSFLNKLIAAGEKLKDPGFSADNEEDVAFLAAFNPEFDRIKENNGKFYEKLSQALNGNRQAQEFLKNHYDPKALLAFMDAQRKTGNEDLARSLAKGLATKEASGNHILDMVGPQGAKERLELGKTDQEVDFALGKFGSDPGFAGRQHTATPHAQADQTYRFPLVAQQEDPVAPPEKEKAKDETPKKVDPPKSGGGKAAINPKGPAALQAFALLKEQCLRCHGPGKKQEKAFALNPDGSPKLLTTAVITRVLARALVSGDPMPPTGELNGDQKAILRRWAEEQQIPIPPAE